MADETIIRTYVINFDRTYKVDSVKDFLEKARKPVASHDNKMYITFETEAATRPLKERDQVTASLDGKTYDLGILVLHAHESRLNVNEPGAGIGLHSVYQALKNCTGDRVIVLIGADDSMKREKIDVHSSTVRSKLYSQLSEDYMYGENGFLFSWNDWSKPAPQHIDALRKFCLREIRGKYEYQPPSSRFGSSFSQKSSDNVQPSQTNENEAAPLLSSHEGSEQLRKRVISFIVVCLIIVFGLVTAGVCLVLYRNKHNPTNSTVIPPGNSTAGGYLLHPM